MACSIYKAIDGSERSIPNGTSFKLFPGEQFVRVDRECNQTINDLKQLQKAIKPKQQVVSNKSTRAKLAVWATKIGIPVPTLLDMSRWLLNKDCPYCQLGTKVLKLLDELGEDKAKELLSRILIAKETNDIGELNNIRLELNG